MPRNDNPTQMDVRLQMLTEKLAPVLRAEEKASPGEARPGYKRTKLGWLPEEWPEVPLKDLGKWRGGGTPLTSNPDYWNGAIPWVSSKDVKGLRLRDTELHITDAGLKESSSVLIPAHSILMVQRSGILRKHLPVATNLVAMAVNQDIKALIPFDHADTEYILYVLEHWNEQILHRCWNEGTTVESVDYGEFLKFQIPFPPVAERSRIAAILGEWDKAISTLGALIAAKQRRKQGLMQELLSGRRRLNGHSGAWRTMRLDQLGTFSKGKGITKNDLRESGVPCVTYGELYTVHHVRIRKFHSFIDSVTAVTSQPIHAGDILFAGSGETADEIGKAAVYLGIEPAYAGGDVIILRPKDIDPIYLSYALTSSTADAQRKKLGQGHSVVHIYPSQLAQMELPIAPSEEQLKMIAFFAALDDEIEHLEQQLTHLTTQKRGLMQQLLTGRVRTR